MRATLISVRKGFTLMSGARRSSDEKLLCGLREFLESLHKIDESLIELTVLLETDDHFRRLEGELQGRATDSSVVKETKLFQAMVKVAFGVEILEIAVLLVKSKELLTKLLKSLGDLRLQELLQQLADQLHDFECAIKPVMRGYRELAPRIDQLCAFRLSAMAKDIEKANNIFNNIREIVGKLEKQHSRLASGL